MGRNEYGKSGHLSIFTSLNNAFEVQVLWILKSLWVVLSETINIWKIWRKKKKKKKKIRDAPVNLTIGLHT